MRRLPDMNRWVLNFLLLLAPLSAGADTPDKDPAVRNLRERFTNARTPLAGDLAYGKSWLCEYRSALSGSREHDTFPDYFRFGPGPDALTVINIGGVMSKNLHFEGSALLGEYFDGTKIFGIDHVRVEANGGLVVEWTLPETNIFVSLFFGLAQLRSVDDFYEAAVGYRECRIQE